MPAARRPSEKQLARDRADRDRFDKAAAVIRSEASQALYKIGVFPDRAYPFASLLNAMALELETLPSGVRREGLAVAAAVMEKLADPTKLGRDLLTISDAPTPAGGDLSAHGQRGYRVRHGRGSIRNPRYASDPRTKTTHVGTNKIALL